MSFIAEAPPSPFSATHLDGSFPNGLGDRFTQLGRHPRLGEAATEFTLCHFIAGCRGVAFTGKGNGLGGRRPRATARLGRGGAPLLARPNPNKQQKLKTTKTKPTSWKIIGGGLFITTGNADLR